MAVGFLPYLPQPNDRHYRKPLIVTYSFQCISLSHELQLGVSVLVKHAAAGHIITYRDLEIVLGIPCVAIVGRPALAKLLSWLRANLRSDINFKVASQTYTDTGTFRDYCCQ